MRYHLTRGVIRAVTGSFTTPSGCSRGFYFVSASYQGRSLISAATELALTVREAMGPDRPPHLITLFATPHSEWGAGLADTPQYIRELLTYEGEQPPVIVGGVVRSVGAGGSYAANEGAPCVALLAAHLPGVRLMPFYTTKSSLPALPGDGWAEVVRATRASTAPASAAAATTSTQVVGVAGMEDSGSTKSIVVPTHAGPQGTVGTATTEASFGQQAASGDYSAAATEAAASRAALEEPVSADCPTVGHAVVASRGLGTCSQRREPTEALLRPPCHQQQDRPTNHQHLMAHQKHAPTKNMDAGSPIVDSRLQPPVALAGSSENQASSVCSTSSTSMSSVAALVLSAPHFVEVEELLKRFGQVAPGMQVIGGVTAPGAWGDSESNWGAVWLNERTYAQGAVGCVLHGPFKLDTIVSPGFRGAGPVMRVTQAHGQYVLELDGEPVQRPLQRAIAEALNSGEFASSLKIGLGDAIRTYQSNSSSGGGGGSGDSHLRTATAAAQHSRQHRSKAVFPSQPGLKHAVAAASGGPRSSPQPPVQQQQQPQPQPQAQRQLVTRNWFFQQGPPRPFMTIQSSAPIANGTPIQVHLQSYSAAHRHMRDRLREYAERLPTGVAAAEGAVGSLALSCSALPFFEGPDVAWCLPRAAFAGGKLEGEFCTTVDGQPSRLHSFTSCLAFLRAATP